MLNLKPLILNPDLDLDNILTAILLTKELRELNQLKTLETKQNVHDYLNDKLSQPAIKQLIKEHTHYDNEHEAANRNDRPFTINNRNDLSVNIKADLKTKFISLKNCDRHHIKLDMDSDKLIPNYKLQPTIKHNHDSLTLWLQTSHKASHESQLSIFHVYSTQFQSDVDGQAIKTKKQVHYDEYTLTDQHEPATSPLYQLFAEIKYFDLVKHQDQNINNRNEITDLAALFYLQHQKLNASKDAPDDKLFETPVPLETQKFIKDFKVVDEADDDTSHDFEIKINEIVDFMLAVKNKKPISDNILNWLVYNSTTPDSKTLESVISIMRNMHLINIFCEPSPIKCRQITNELYRDKAFAKQYNINHIYQINKPYQQITNKKYVTLVHGTNNESVLTILRDGIRKRNELSNDSRANFVGQGLGDGVYFARTDQIAKSSNYTNTSVKHTGYIFLCDVYYNDCKNVENYGDYTNEKEDLIHAVGTGSFGRDEFLAKNTKNIQIKYLIEISIKGQAEAVI